MFYVVINELYEDFNPENDKPGVYTGFYDLDSITGGLHGGDLFILAARPSVGKTSLALGLAANLGIANHRVQLYSLEMGKKQNIQRLISMGTGIPLERFRDRKLDESQLRMSIEYVGDVLNKIPLHIDDTANIPIQSLRARAIRNAVQYGKPTIIIVDYLQLVSDLSQNDRFQEVSRISRQLKALGRELDCTVLALSQLSRAVEGRAIKVPILSDLRESGQIEQDADIVAFIHREELHDKDTDKKGIAELHIAKHRNGALGVVPLRFDGITTKFDNLQQYRGIDGY